MNSIFSRRSIRKFKPDLVSRNHILEILKAGMNSPSAGNEQPWQFLVITNREALDKIPKIHPYSKMLYEAPVAIIVCGDLHLVKYQEYWSQDCAAATQNMLLAIDELGLGGVWLGVYPKESRIEKLRLLFNIPEHIIPFSIIAMGKPNERKGPNDRFLPERIKFETF